MNKQKLDHKLSFEYNEITPQIFLGTNMCCQIRFDEELLKKGVHYVISLEGEKIDQPFGVQSSLWLPVSDNEAPNEKQFILGVSMIDKIISLGEKVYIHCEFGHGRAPTLLAAYFISQGDSVEEALQKIKEKRPVIHPEKSQIKALKGFEKRIKEKAV